MIEIGNTLVSRDLLEEVFCCVRSVCRGACCVEGVAGAPLEDEEPHLLEAILPYIRPFMTEAGRRAVDNEGVAVMDPTGELVTPLIDNRECAYAVCTADRGMNCAIEAAYRAGKTSFPKPISCHLYPVRITRYDRFDAVNYHSWDVCHDSLHAGQGVPVYRFVRDALIRKYGETWYGKLEKIAASQPKS